MLFPVVIKVRTGKIECTQYARTYTRLNNINNCTHVIHNKHTHEYIKKYCNCNKNINYYYILTLLTLMHIVYIFPLHFNFTAIY